MAKQKLLGKARPNGSAAAALLAGGIGALALGLMTILAEAYPAVKNGLKFYSPSGPLSGVTTVAVAIWLVAWIGLGSLWSEKDVDFERASTWALVLLGLGLLGTFPLFFGLFASG